MVELRARLVPTTSKSFLQGDIHDRYAPHDIVRRAWPACRDLAPACRQRARWTDHRPRGRLGRVRDGGRSLYLRLSPGDDGDDPARHHQRGRSPRAPRARWARSSSSANIPTPAFRDVTAPNADTLYTTAFFDVGKEPWIFSIPDAGWTATPCFPCSTAGRTCSRCPASAPRAPAPQTYAITGPGWAGKLPDGVNEYKSPTGYRLDPRAASTARARRRTTRPSTPPGRHASFIRSAPTARITRRRRARSIPRST